MKKIWSSEEVLAMATGRRSFMKGVSAFGGGLMMGPVFMTQAKAAKDLTLQTMVWEGWDMMDEMAAWRAAQGGVNFEAQAIGVQEDVNTRLGVSNPPPIDIAVYNQGYADLYINTLKLNRPLDPAKIPNYNADDIFDAFYMKEIWAQDGKLYGVPIGWGINVPSFNPAVIPEIKSYKDMLAPELKGKLVFPDDTLAVWPVAARLVGLGDKFPFLSHDELAMVFDNLALYRAQTKVVSPTYGDVVSLLVSGEADVMFAGWTGVPAEAAKQGLQLKLTIPEEGAGTWCDSWFMPQSCDNEELAYGYLNESTSAEVQAAISNRNVCATVNKKAVPMLSEEVRSIVDFDNVDAVLKSAPLTGIPPLESEEFATYADWLNAWNEFKAL